MAAKPPPDDETVASTGAGGTLGLRSVTGPFANTQLAAEIGRSLQTLYQACLDDALPDKLAALVRQLQEREEWISPIAAKVTFRPLSDPLPSPLPATGSPSIL